MASPSLRTTIAEQASLDLLYSDAAVLVVDKPHGLRSVPGLDTTAAAAAAAPGANKGKRKRQERWSEVVSELAPADLPEASRHVAPKLRREAQSVPRKRSKFLSFSERSLRLEPDAAAALYTVLDDRLARAEEDEGLSTTDSALGRLQRATGERGLAAVHRLDMETSGVLVVARSASAARALGEQFAQRSIEKAYIAVVHRAPGRFPPDVYQSGRVSLALRADLDARPLQVVDAESGKASVTRWEVVPGAWGAGRTRMRLVPETGRTHQLRVHCASGFEAPIVGDTLYDTSWKQSDGRLLLHAQELAFVSPATDERVEVRAECPF